MPRKYICVCWVQVQYFYWIVCSWLLWPVDADPVKVVTHEKSRSHPCREFIWCPVYFFPHPAVLSHLCSGCCDVLLQSLLRTRMCFFQLSGPCRKIFYWQRKQLLPSPCPFLGSLHLTTGGWVGLESQPPTSVGVMRMGHPWELPSDLAESSVETRSWSPPLVQPCVFSLFIYICWSLEYSS